MARKTKKKKTVKKVQQTYNGARKKSLIYTLAALGFIMLTLFWNWLFIIPAVFFLYLGRRYLLG